MADQDDGVTIVFNSDHKIETGNTAEEINDAMQAVTSKKPLLKLKDPKGRLLLINPAQIRAIRTSQEFESASRRRLGSLREQSRIADYVAAAAERSAQKRRGILRGPRMTRRHPRAAPQRCATPLAAADSGRWGGLHCSGGT